VQKNGATTVIEEAGRGPAKKAARKITATSSGRTSRSKTTIARQPTKNST